MGCAASRVHAPADDACDEKAALLQTQAGSAPALRAQRVPTGDRLAALRRHMAAAGVDAYLVGTTDAHASEYTASCDRRCEFVSGFSGSAGTAVVLADSAHLFTDGRYHIQAAAQLDEHWTLHKVGAPRVLDWDAWLPTALARGARLGVDATLIAFADAQTLGGTLAPHGVQLVFPRENLVDAAWGSARPAPVLADVHEHPMHLAGVSAANKIRSLRAWLAGSGGGVYVLSALDEVAWLLNVRGASIPCNPVFPAYVTVSADDATLYVDERMVHDDVRAYLEEHARVRVRAYGDVLCSLAAVPPRTRVCIHEKASYAVGTAAQRAAADDAVSTASSPGAAGATSRIHVLPADSPVALAKARKNATELDGMRRAYLRDGAAWARWAAWLDETITVRRDTVTEHAAAAKLEEMRAEDPMYAGMQAYDAISAAGPNAALPHYETPAHGSRVIGCAAPYLNDSGPQYYDGTIDTTRTTHFGRPSAEQKRAFTRVLQGHIAIAAAVFPRGTTGAQLDMLARQPLFQDGYNYLHGTGHGIGAFLNVHEGPQGFSSSSGGARVPVALDEGMVLSNEPGFYEEGHFGVRTESTVVVQRTETHRQFGGADAVWYRFDTITRVPIDTRLVDDALLSPGEKTWLSEYNALVRRDILPLVRGDQRAEKWLQRQ
ncbi:Xaa-Pro aminopeptidase [Malassezia sp. CBS 17886]|nr:Xaa-Pro aminopeptidase [Malassezia sp. CBS 17886]